MRLPLREVAVAIVVTVTVAIAITVAGGWLPGSWEGTMEETGEITGVVLVLIKSGRPPVQKYCRCTGGGK